MFFKTHNTLLYFRGIDSPLKDATKGMIQIVRDSDDMAISCANHNDIKTQCAPKSIAENRNHVQR